MSDQMRHAAYAQSAAGQQAYTQGLMAQTEKPAPAETDFGGAIAMLKRGQRVARKGWNGRGMYLALQQPCEHSKMRQPYIYIVPVGGEPVPWVASQPDMLGEDWVEVT